MAWCDTQAKQDGVDMEEPIIKRFVSYYKSHGHPNAYYEKSTYEENTQMGIDWWIISDRPFKNGKYRIPVDTKFSWSFTLINNKGKNTLYESKAEHYVWEDPKKLGVLTVINKDIFKKIVQNDYPKLFENKYKDGSWYFPLRSYLEKYKNVKGLIKEISA